MKKNIANEDLKTGMTVTIVISIFFLLAIIIQNLK